MALDLALSDLSQLDRIRRVLDENDINRQFAYLGMAEVHISDTVLDLLADVIDRHLATAGRPASKTTQVRMIVDPVLIRRGAEDLKVRVMDMLSVRYAAQRVVLDDGHPVLHADEAMQDAATEASVGADCIVSVGGGTITDIAKIAADRNKVPVHVVVQTAASVDGFTDNFSVVLRNGVKQTLLSRWPEAVLTDTQVIADAPHHLNAAGFGELLSMYAAPGDWYLASKFGMDKSYSPVLLDLLGLCGEGAEDWSAGIGTGDPDACARLATALAMRGIVTGVGGTTATLSGMEHLISHMLDMVNGELHKPMGLHGAQVGVGSVIRAAAWEVFCERVKKEGVRLSRTLAPYQTYETHVKEVFASLDPSGRIGEECWTRYRTKLDKWSAADASLQSLFSNWDEHIHAQNELTLDSYKVARLLHRAGAPKRFTDLDPAPSAERLKWVVANCQFMRERFTVADLLFLSGWWDDAGVERVLSRVDSALEAAA